jgi:uncharacterized protein (UPF0276 family)
MGHLTPDPFSLRAVDVLAANIAEVQQLVDVPVILENITYPFRLPGSDLDEADFLRRLVERTGCGLLLDATNLHTNAVNHRFDPLRFLDTIPLESVVQLHFTGGHCEDGVLIDSHSAPTPPEVWSLMERILARAPVKGVVLERDEDLPPFGTLLDELEHAREIGRRHGRWDSRASRKSSSV